MKISKLHSWTPPIFHGGESSQNFQKKRVGFPIKREGLVKKGTVLKGKKSLIFILILPSVIFL